MFEAKESPSLPYSSAQFNFNMKLCLSSTEVECQEPNIPDAKRAYGGSGPYGYKVTLEYKCVTGFSMTGSGRMVCLEHGWSHIPKCKGKMSVKV